MRRVVMALFCVISAASLYLAELAEAGFPDGHLSAYQRWAAPYQWAAVGGMLVLAVGFVALRGAASRWFSGLLFAAIAVALAGFVAVPAIGLGVLQLEHGQGG